MKHEDMKPGMELINGIREMKTDVATGKTSYTGRVLETRVRVIEYIEQIGEWRVADARETREDRWLIQNDRTWACPLENLRLPVDAMSHRDGLVVLG